MIRRGGPGGGMDGVIAGLMLHLLITWIVMIGLVGVLICLVVTARRARRVTGARPRLVLLRAPMIEA